LQQHADLTGSQLVKPLEGVWGN